MIACLDVHYQGNAGRAGCALMASWMDEQPVATCVADIDRVEPYRPGRFFLRELPCLLAVLRLATPAPDVLVIDGYVWLSPDGKPGLGAHLHRSLGSRVVVIGVAKSAYLGMHDSPLLARVFRGGSRRPLFVTSAGIDCAQAADLVALMPGRYRIPDALRHADRLARSAR